MSNVGRRNCGLIITATLLVLTATSHLLAGDPKEERMVNQLNAYLNRSTHPPRRSLPPTGIRHATEESPTYAVMLALGRFEDDYPTSVTALPLVKRLLTDSNKQVRCKAARALGAVHAEVAPADIQAICAMLKSTDTNEAEDALKALRGLNAPSAVPEILPLLKSPETHNIRDACRTLAVLGGKDVIPAIEPLLQHKDPAVQKDATKAIAALRKKS